MWWKIFEYEVFMLEDLNVEDIKTAYATDPKIVEFFEEYGVPVKDCNDLDRQLFKDLFRTAVILKKAYNKTLKDAVLSEVYNKPISNKTKELIETVRTTVRMYNEMLNDWLDSLGIPKADISEAVHIPSYQKVSEIIAKEAVLWG